MNLENLNLVELNAQEVQEVEGGWWWAVAEIAYELLYAPDDVKKGYAAGKEFFNN